jgi:hypothetical protein
MKEIKIFISYSHEDTAQFKEFKKGIETHSKTSKQIKWKLWSDIEIPVGSLWHETIQEKVAEANAVLLLVSASFFNSDYIKNEEFQKFVSKFKNIGFTFFPVLLSDCDFSHWEELIKIQFFSPQGQDYNVKQFINKIVPFDYINEQSYKNTYFKNCVAEFEKSILANIVETSKLPIKNNAISRFKKVHYGRKIEVLNKRISFLEANILDGFKLNKNYMGIIIPRIGDKYLIYVYKEFTLLEPKESIKCRIHINNKQKIENPSLKKEDLKLSAYISHTEHGNFNICEKIDEISTGEEYLQFRIHLKQDHKGNDVKIEIGDKISIFYTYEVYCAHYGNELVRKTSVFLDSELMCELIYPQNSENHNFEFYERANDERREIKTLNTRNCSKHSNKSFLYSIHPDSNFKRILDKYFKDKNYDYYQVDYKKCIKDKNKPLQHIYTLVAEWNSNPFLTDPEMYLTMERYINDGSPSGFTKKNNTSPEYTPYSMKPNFSISGVLTEEYLRDYGNPPDWLKKNEILIHPEYNKYFYEKKDCNYLVIPTASARTVFMTEQNCYAKLQYNNTIGRLKRIFTPEKIANAVKISSILKENFDKGIFSKDLFFLPESFGRIIDFGTNFKEKFETQYLGMIIREYIPYPNKSFADSQWRLIPSFSLFSKEYNKTNFISKSIIELLFDLRNDTELSYETFLLEKILKPVFRLYFELLIKTGLHIEGHAQNVLFLVLINNNKLDVIGTVIRDFESFDKDLSIIKANGLDVLFDVLSDKINDPNENERYMKRNSFLFDFKLGEYLITPILEHSYEVKKDFNIQFVLKEIKKFNSNYIKQLKKGFYPKDKWYSYEKVEFDRSTADRPWIENNEQPKYR